MASLHYADAPRPPPSGILIAWLGALRRRWAKARRARREVLSLRNASDHLLSDIGVTRAELEQALARPIWFNPGDRLISRR